jgi:thiopeptide-type bacteriocin biosynthesis protein
MSSPKDNDNWLSVYIYFKGDIYDHECDKILIEVLKPFIDKSKKEKLINKYFFIRYSELGNHVRLRFSGIEKTLNDTVVPMFENYISEYKDQGLFNLPMAQENTDSFNKSILWIPYIPEYERYGGEYAISLAEDFFYCSSIVALNILSQLNNIDRSNRLAQGLVSILILLFIFIKEKNAALEFIKRYSDNYLSSIAKSEEHLTEWNNLFQNGFEKQADALTNIIDRIWSALENDYELQKPWGLYQRKIIKVKSSLNRLYNNSRITVNPDNLKSISGVYRTILPSYIHMMNNRLGITIIEESYLASVIYLYFLRTKEEIHNEPTK